jgi:hypothetical protein
MSRDDERLKTRVEESTSTREKSTVIEFVYYESMKRNLKIKPIYESRCNGILQTTADSNKRVVFGDLRSHLGCDLWFSFCTPRDRPGTKTEP